MIALLNLTSIFGVTIANVNSPIFREGPYRFFFSREETRPHVCIRPSDGNAKFWLEPRLELAENHGIPEREITAIVRILERRGDEIRTAWQGHGLASDFDGRPINCAALIGAVSFACGFFGPLVLNPAADQGPLLAIFTGPLGATVGFLFGFLSARSRISPPAFKASLAILTVAAAAAILYVSFPEDRFEGFVVDAEVLRCESPSAFLNQATNVWRRSPAVEFYHTARPGWREDIPSMIARDPGVVLTVLVHRRWDIYERRKPWNRGELVSRRTKGEATQRYFARSRICSSYPSGSRALYSPQEEPPRVLPPDNLPTFLGLQVLREVPNRYRIP